MVNTTDQLPNTMVDDAVQLKAAKLAKKKLKKEKKSVKKSKKEKDSKKTKKRKADTDQVTDTSSDSDSSLDTATKKPKFNPESLTPITTVEVIPPKEYVEETSQDVQVLLKDIRITGKDAPEPCTDFSCFPGKIESLLKAQGFTAPTQIQMASWPIAISGRDIIAVAKTGSGKTLGYALPGMMHIRPRRSATKYGDAPICLVLAPTRELACQIEVETSKISQPCGLRTKCVYGGVPRGEQLRGCREGMEVLVATPGRLIDFVEFGQVKLDKISFVCLDEADRMLDMGFEPDIRKIMAKLPEGYQTLLYTATWPKKVRALANEFLKNPVTVHVGDTSNQLVASKNITQIVKVVSQREKNDELHKLLLAINSDEQGFAKKQQAKILIFCGTKRYCDQLAVDVRKDRFTSRALHGDMLQDERDRTLQGYRDNKFKILVATDVAARGLDINDIDYVINYDCPMAMEDYIHRIGRTGRANKTGTAYTLFTPEKDRSHAFELTKILKQSGQDVPAALERMGLAKGGKGGGGMPAWMRNRRNGRGGRGGGRGRGGRGRRR